MGLKATLDTLEGLDTALVPFYKKTDAGKYVLDAEGVEDVSGLKSALDKTKLTAKEKDDQLKALQKQFEGIDPEEARAIMGRMANSEEAKLIAEGKMDQVIEKRIEKRAKALEDAVKEANTRADTAEGKAKKYSQRVLDDQIRAAAASAGLFPQAIEDALFRGRAMFSLDEEGRAVQLGDDGHPVMGKDGKTLFNPTEWLSTMKESAPHWFPAAGNGGGAGGTRMNGAAGPDLSKLAPAARLSAARAAGKA